jgi:1-acyl-sn-glycerol-3-phosphate acyltransferase
MILLLVDKSYESYFNFARGWWSNAILGISGVKVTVSGLENIDKNRSYVFVSNHSSQFDIPALQNSIPNRMGIVFKKELAKIPLFGWQLKWGPYVMIDRQNAEKALKSIEEAKKKMVEQNISPVVFAEGTRSKTGEVQPFKRGAFYLATKVGFPIVPVSIIGSEKILPKGRFRINKGRIHVHFGDPVETSNVITRKDELELMEKVRNIIINNFVKGK